MLEQSHEALVQGACGNIPAQPLYQKLAALFAEEALKPKVKVCII